MTGPTTAPPPDEGDKARLFADFFNGADARRLRVELHLVPAARPTDLRLTMPDGSHQHWPLAELRRVPDLAVKSSEIMLMRAGGGLERLHMKGEGVVAEIAALAPDLRRRPPPVNRWRIARWSVAAVASVALIVFVLVPLMADQLATYLPPEGEKALGDATFEQIRTVLDDSNTFGLEICDNPEGVAAFDKILARLNPQVDLPYDIQYTVLDHDMVNAFALPGGRIVFFRGLIEDAESADEVAAVFAHEIGHVVNRDPTRDALRSAGSIGVLGLLLGDFAGGTAVLFLTNQLINAQYSQKAEARADDYAHDLLARAGLSPAALASFFERLLAQYGEEEGFVSHFASHPLMIDRIRAARDAAAKKAELAPLLTEREWAALRRICD